MASLRLAGPEPWLFEQPNNCS